MTRPASVGACSIRRTVLLVDDCVAQRDLYKLVLQEQFDIVTASRGDEALQAARRSHPDAIVMDICLPGLDGLSVCRRLQEDASTLAIPVILMTGDTHSNLSTRGSNEGAVAVLRKPCSADTLFKALAEALHGGRQPGPNAAAELSGPMNQATSVGDCPAHVLVVDDSAANREDLVALLAGDGYLVTTATNGAEALDAVERDEPDIVLLDVMMPLMNGFETCAALRARPSTCLLPDALLLKPGGLTSAERDVMEQHTVIGDRLCGELKSMKRARPIVRHHHERLDGSGYPDGFGGNDIPVLAQILSIVDAFDAATTARPYKPPGPVSQVSRELRDEAHRGWRRADFVDAFLTISAEGRLPRVFR